ncbi:Hypothetical protein NocV09_00201890 [Nannochloropsis oceanica]
MTMGAGLFGASLGIFVKMASNSMRKIPLRREPWDYPLFMIVGTWVGYKYVSLEASLTERVNEKRAALEKPPVELGGIMTTLKKAAE